MNSADRMARDSAEQPDREDGPPSRNWPLENRGPEALQALLRGDQDAATRSLDLLTRGEQGTLAWHATRLVELIKARAPQPSEYIVHDDIRDDPDTGGHSNG